MSSPSMLTYLAAACREARQVADRLQVHVAAEAGVSESTIWKFEARQGWPRDVDRILNAYASDLELKERDLWARALELWEIDE